ncbi:MAG TPA: 50S ribosomal protein L21 [Phycisphaerales bacterium]|jgi:large subunit ribosomal protein L21|nr:50S ribosomal protein L21 [Phycisphaerales bacterium]
MYAIIEDSGTQIKLTSGAILEVDLRECSDGDTLTFDKVLMIGGDGEPTLGTPYVEGASVAAEVLEEFKGDKLDIIKFKRRKGYRRKTGHRQRYLRIKVGEISAKAKKTTKKKTTKKKTTKKKTAKKTDSEE